MIKNLCTQLKKRDSRIQSYKRNFILKKEYNSLYIVDGALPQISQNNSCLIPIELTHRQKNKDKIMHFLGRNFVYRIVSW